MIQRRDADAPVGGYVAAFDVPVELDPEARAVPALATFAMGNSTERGRFLRGTTRASHA